MQKSAVFLLTRFAIFVADVRAMQLADIALFGQATAAETIARYANVLASQFPGTPNAFSLLCHLAKFVIGFLLAQEAGEISETVAQQRIAHAIKETAKHLS